MTLQEILSFSPLVIIQFIVVQAYILWCSKKQKSLSKRAVILGIGSMSLIAGSVILVTWIDVLQTMLSRNAISVEDLAFATSLTLIMGISSYAYYIPVFRKQKSVSKKVKIVLSIVLIGAVLLIWAGPFLSWVDWL